MDNVLLRKLAIICKDFYVIRTIDDLFVDLGAEPAWWTSPAASTGSDRMNRVYGWAEGIKRSAPDRYDEIFDRVAVEVYYNQEISDSARKTIVRDVKAIEGHLEVEDRDRADFEPVFSTLVRLLASEGLAREVAVVAHARTRIEREGYEPGPSGDVILYNLYFQIPPRLYAQIADSRELCVENLKERLRAITMSFPNLGVSSVYITPATIADDKWRDKAIAWLAGEGVNNQGRVRSNNVAPKSSDGLLFRSQPEIELYKALKSAGVSFAPLPVFVCGGIDYRRIEPDFVVLKGGIVMIIEVDGDTVHQETPAEAHARTTMLAHEGAHVERVKASECDTPEKATACAKRLLQVLAKLKAAR